MMVGLIASLICALVIWELFRLNREENVRTSKALWVPVLWLFFAASRNVSEWFHLSAGGNSDQYLEGSPLDRAVFTAILALGVIVLLGRTRQVGTIIKSNLPILFYFLYCGISALWSDFPDVSFKRWFRAMGDVVMVLIVLTDPKWLVALRRLFTRIGFVVIPLSILFIRYFPSMGRTYSRGGAPSWTGVATDKNALGMISLVFGLAALYRFLQVRKGEDTARKKGPMIANGVIFLMALFLLWEANSATAFSCFFLAAVPMVLTYLFRFARKPAALHGMVFAAVGISFSALFLNFGSGLVEDLGRNSTLTGRTAIWSNALTLVKNPLVGTGFESFWVGPRLAEMETLIQQTVNQAHNGYLEVYLNLGWVGVVLLSIILISGYRRITAAVRSGAPVASLRLAYFIVAVTYNFTEASFKMMSPVWMAFLIATMILPETPVQEDFSSFGKDRAGSLGETKPEPAGSVVHARHPVRV
jgi:exopolysaccharide production protein ExoQ